MAEARRAIIDIGSNSVRLVVFAGAERAPFAVFNEKLAVGLGAELATTGSIPPKRFRRALDGLARFRALTDAMELSSVRTVATAAVRDAKNGDAFLAAARDIGLDVELFSGREEARAAGLGVICAIPRADGIVADLGGGSLELVRIGGGETRHHSSFPLGVLRLPALRRDSGKSFSRTIAKLLKGAGWPAEDRNLPLYLVGGSWRALARYDMMMRRCPLPVVSGHHFPLDSVPRIARRLAATDLATLEAMKGLSTSRTDSMADAAALLVALTRTLEPSDLIVSTAGLREGLLYDAMSAPVRAQDPLLVAAEHEGRRFARFAPHGRAVDDWIAPLFGDDDAEARRLRLAAGMMAEVAFSANPDFRPERAVEIALHGPWLGIDLSDRLVLAQALHAAAGGSGRAVTEADARHDARLVRASHWGLAVRLAERLSGGAPHVFSTTDLRLGADGTVELKLSSQARALAGEQVEKRLRQLANALGRGYRVVA